MHNNHNSQKLRKGQNVHFLADGTCHHNLEIHTKKGESKHSLIEIDHTKSKLCLPYRGGYDCRGGPRFGVQGNLKDFMTYIFINTSNCYI